MLSLLIFLCERADTKEGVVCYNKWRQSRHKEVKRVGKMVKRR